MSGLHKLAWWLLIIGGLNWLLIGLFNFDIVMKIFGSGMLTRIVYDLVGVSTLIILFGGKKKM